MTSEIPTTVYFVRHAESANNKHHMSGLSEYERQPDPSITELGQVQAKMTADFFSDKKIDAIFVSPMLRCLQTALPVLKISDHPEICVHCDIHEEGGVFRGHRREGHATAPVHGMTRSEICSVLGVSTVRLLGAAFVEGRGWWRGGMETESEISDRVDRFVEFLWNFVDTRRPGTVVVYTHGLFMDSLVFKFLGWSGRDRTQRVLRSPMLLSGNCSFAVLHLYASDRAVAVAGLNCAEHLPSDLRTGHSIGKKYKCDTDKHFVT